MRVQITTVIKFEYYCIITTVISLNIAMAATQIYIIKDQLNNFDISYRFFLSYACSCLIFGLFFIKKGADNP